ncbi:MAG: hypothetical protein KDA75_04920 [Planctomycetaceae bacterium]|nr:hypothetical protein [Planctomycetaceae bacterium]
MSRSLLCAICCFVIPGEGRGGTPHSRQADRPVAVLRTDRPVAVRRTNLPVAVVCGVGYRATRIRQ